MTEAEILALPAGRDTDRLVAAMLGDRQDADGWWYSADDSKISCEDGGPRFYTTVIGDAWRLTEAEPLLADAGGCQQWYWTVEQTALGWRVRVSRRYDRTMGKGPRPVEAEAPTAAHAICLAALLLGKRIRT